jgi:hypothetical protein
MTFGIRHASLLNHRMKLARLFLSWRLRGVYTPTNLARYACTGSPNRQHLSVIQPQTPRGFATSRSIENKSKMKTLPTILVLIAACLGLNVNVCQAAKFKVIAFYTGKDDLAHISYVHEANKWFPKTAAENDFSYDQLGQP